MTIVSLFIVLGFFASFFSGYLLRAALVAHSAECRRVVARCAHRNHCIVQQIAANEETTRELTTRLRKRLQQRERNRAQDDPHDAE